MLFQKGRTKTGGRTKGSKSLKIIQWQETGKELITGGLERAQQIMQNADDDKYMDYFFKLLEYYKPKLQRSDVNQYNQGKVVIEVVRADPEDTDSFTKASPLSEASNN